MRRGKKERKKERKETWMVALACLYVRKDTRGINANLLLMLRKTLKDKTACYMKLRVEHRRIINETCYRMIKYKTYKKIHANEMSKRTKTKLQEIRN